MTKEALMEMGIEETLAEAAAEAIAREREEENARRDEEHAAALRGLTLDYAVRAALSDSFDPALAATLLDREALTVGEDGSVAGLEEQVRALRENKPFLFRAEDRAPGITLGAAPAAEPAAPWGAVSMRDAIEGHFQTHRK